jgi:hypothetical protein
LVDNAGAQSETHLALTPYQHGMFTCDAIKHRQEIRSLISEMRVLAEGILQR